MGLLGPGLSMLNESGDDDAEPPVPEPDVQLLE